MRPSTGDFGWAKHRTTPDHGDVQIGRLPNSVQNVILVSVLVCLGASIFYLFDKEGEYRQPPFYMALGLLFFALSTISNLVFANTKAFMKLSTAHVVAGMTGPAVLWFVALVLFSKLVVTEDFFRQEVEKLGLTDLQLELAEYEAALGWYTYDEWGQRNGDFQDLFISNGGNPTSLERTLAGMALRKFPDDRRLLDNAEVHTLWIYSKGANGVFKLQRIQGDNNNAVAGMGSTVKIPFKAVASSDTRGEGPSTVSILFQGHRNQRDGQLLYDRAHVESGDFVQVTGQHIDSLIVTWYRDYADLDYLFVDTRGYSSRSGHKSYIGVLSRDTNVESAALWTGRQSTTSIPPISFSRLRANEQSSFGEFGDWFGEWNQLLKKFRANGIPGADTTTVNQFSLLMEKVDGFTSDEPAADPEDFGPFGLLSDPLGDDLSGPFSRLVRQPAHDVDGRAPGEATRWFEVDEASNVLTLLIKLYETQGGG